MSKFLRKATTQVFAAKTFGSFRTLSKMGVGIHWGNSSFFKWSTQMDPNLHRLFYQVG
jgi:hypothetical protein